MLWQSRGGIYSLLYCVLESDSWLYEWRGIRLALGVLNTMQQPFLMCPPKYYNIPLMSPSGRDAIQTTMSTSPKNSYFPLDVLLRGMLLCSLVYTHLSSFKFCFILIALLGMCSMVLVIRNLWFWDFVIKNIFFSGIYG